MTNHIMVTQDIAQRPTRRIAKQYDNAGTAAGTTKAVPAQAPASFANGDDRIAMGVVPSTGMVSFICDGAAEDFTIYFFSATYAKIATSTKGWYLGAEAASQHTKNVLQHSLCSFKGPVGAPFYLKRATTAADNILVNAPAYEKNPNTEVVV